MKDVVIRIGKNGITDNAVVEINKNLDANNIVKLKVLKNLIQVKNKSEIKEELTKKLPPKVFIEKSVGNVFLLNKKK